MSAEMRLLFTIGAQLGMSVAAVESLSVREVNAWARFFDEGMRGQHAANDGALELRTLSRETLRGMFSHARR